MSVKNDRQYGCREFYLNDFEPFDSSSKTVFPENQVNRNYGANPASEGTDSSDCFGIAPQAQQNNWLVSTGPDPVDRLDSMISKTSNIGKRKFLNSGNELDKESEAAFAEDRIGHLPETVSYDPWLAYSQLEPMLSDAVAAEPGLTPSQEASAPQDAIKRAQPSIKIPKGIRNGNVQAASACKKKSKSYSEKSLQEAVRLVVEESMEKAAVRHLFAKEGQRIPESTLRRRVTKALKKKKEQGANLQNLTVSHDGSSRSLSPSVQEGVLQTDPASQILMYKDHFVPITAFAYLPS